MVWIEITKGNTGGIMVDGYMPEGRYLREMALRLINSERLAKIEKITLRNYIGYVQPNKISDNRLINLFCTLKSYVKSRQRCPTAKPECSSYYFAMGKNFRSLESPSKRFLRNVGAEAARQVLMREYENNRTQAPAKHYLQNVVIFSRKPGYGCGSVSECCWEWVDLLKFEVKRRGTYVDFEAFKEIWEKILERDIAHYIEPSG